MMSIIGKKNPVRYDLLNVLKCRVQMQVCGYVSRQYCKHNAYCYFWKCRLIGQCKIAQWDWLKNTTYFSSLSYTGNLELKVQQLEISRIALNGLYYSELCKRKFGKKTDLLKHLCIHLDSHSHVCQMCPRNFVQKTSLNTHVKSHMRRL